MVAHCWDKALLTQRQSTINLGEGLSQPGPLASTDPSVCSRETPSQPQGTDMAVGLARCPVTQDNTLWQKRGRQPTQHGDSSNLWTLM
jgi:hypothetical protein